MTVQNAFFIFLLAFSGITGWLMLREPVPITLSGTEPTKTESEQTAQPNPQPTGVTVTPPSDRTHPVRDRLNQIVLPVIDLENANLEEAINFLRLRTHELTADSKPFSFSCIIKKTAIASDLSHSEQPSDQQTIPLYAEDLSLAEALDLICEKANCHWEISEHSIVITPLED